MQRSIWKLVVLSFAAGCLLFASPSAAAEDEEEKSPYSAGTFAGLEFRALGPALSSGRISDIATHPENVSTWLVTTASGGVWRTENAGTTWTPVMDGAASYSFGCVTWDQANPLVVWVGGGENNSQRSVAYGDGVYKSVDGGHSFENVGLGESEHIGKILVHPNDSATVYVAAQGPLWRSGGDRGLYRTRDGGTTWDLILEISENTGITDVVMDPRDPDVLYAASYQRRRHVWTLINGGPEGAIHKSTDGGESWKKLERGLPDGDIGRIGLAIAPTNGNLVYAIIEAAGDGSGFYRTTDAGASWKKMSDYVSGSPQYYNEILVDPTDEDVIYSNDTWFQRSEDGGASWTRANDGTMHVDNHAVWIDPRDRTHLVVGNDGGVYESFDYAKTWSFKTNLPITQFYKTAIDDEMPFYNVYGGTQDNNTIGGPSRNTSANGIQNSDWFITLGGDGFEPAIEPGNPDIVYSQWQYGNLARYDRKSGETIDIQPQPKADDEPFVWNWSSALVISPHSPTRLYFGGNYLFRSDDRGDHWTRISDNLTRQLDRNKLEVMGRVWSVDTVAKNRSTSIYGNVVALSESPGIEGLLYAGTDDGLVWMTPDAGGEWTRKDKFKGVPEMSYVSSLTASMHDADTVYATFDNHKKGDFKPYVLKSTNRGRSWQSIAGDLPDRGHAHDIVEDPVDPSMLFVGTEFGVFFTKNGGKSWIQLKGGIPTIACRDLEIQPRENDLVVGTFGRGFYVLDDYTPLRQATPAQLEKEAAVLFPVRKSWMFMERSPLGLPGKSSMGHQQYIADNPPVGAVFTYYLAEGLKKREELRQADEREIWQKEDPIEYPSWDELRAEDRERDPKIVLTVRDDRGSVVRRIEGPIGKGLHRVHWDFRYPSARPTNLSPPAWRSPWADDDAGPMAMPGEYTVELAKIHDGTWTDLAGPVQFQCEALAHATLPAQDKAALAGFQRRTSDLQRAVLGAVRAAGEAQERVNHVRRALLDTPGEDTRDLQVRLDEIEGRLHDLREELTGDRTIASRYEATKPSLTGRVGRVVSGHWYSTSPATGTQRENFEIVAAQLPGLLERLRELVEKDLGTLEGRLEELGGPWTPGRLPRWNDQR